jgi:hypothetical protein
MKMPRSLETSGTTHFMAPRHVAEHLSPEQLYNEKFKFREEFIVISALSSRLSLDFIAMTLFLLHDPGFETWRGERFFLF